MYSHCEYVSDSGRKVSHGNIMERRHRLTDLRKQRTPLNLRGLGIPSRPCIKLLGVEIDNELRWKQQGAVAIKKGQDWLIQFSRLSRASKGIATKYMRQLYMAVAIPRMLYAADVFLPPVAIDPRRREEGKRRGGQATLGKLASIQRKAGAMSITAGDAADTTLVPCHYGSLSAKFNTVQHYE